MTDEHGTVDATTPAAHRRRGRGRLPGRLCPARRTGALLGVRQADDPRPNRPAPRVCRNPEPPNPRRNP